MSLYETAVDQVQAIARFRRQLIEHPLEDAAPRPTIEAVVDRGVRTITLGQIAPGCTGAQNVEDPVQHPPVVLASRLPLARQ